MRRGLKNFVKGDNIGSIEICDKERKIDL